MGIKGVKLNKRDIIDAIHLKRGVISNAADYLGCHRDTIYDWMERDNDIIEAVKKARLNDVRDRTDKDTDLTQLAYDSAKDLLNKRDPTLTIFILKTKGGFIQSEIDRSFVVQHIDKPYRNNAKNDPDTLSV